MPSAINPPTGCHLNTRCPEVMPRCQMDEPKLRLHPALHSYSCHLDLTQLTRQNIT